ncbi:hypothetical protein [Paludisphaera rhizosphaerae]|uniref:hypothetical protein n=1 Tax=Paludisphaera rhizosphaerae TaxID=2711216 RepID=UPI0013EAFABF|nr:hypothetical protein [Paludisphaera rhizosphaerae]
MSAKKDPNTMGDEAARHDEGRRSSLAKIEGALIARRLDEAVELLERLTDVEPDCAEALALMGAVLEARGNEHGAFHEYRRALALDPSLARARDGLLRYCQRKGLDFNDPRINPAASQ